MRRFALGYLAGAACVLAWWAWELGQEVTWEAVRVTAERRADLDERQRAVAP